MKIEIEKISYNDIASVGLDGIIRTRSGRDNATGLACHRGERRSVAGMSVLNAAQIPVANKFGVRPTINYKDLMTRNFGYDKYGMFVEGKTDFSFTNLVIFHDKSQEEIEHIRMILGILDIEMEGVLSRIFLAYVRDDDGLLGLE
ncbi:MAG: hypothetical protein ABII80_02525 [bacterium]